ncbi:MAG: WG repeat-containing protein [Rectinemataceae bacterium]|nr:WG repeat-containing protein [Rectinemataceae bacterium]
MKSIRKSLPVLLLVGLFLLSMPLFASPSLSWREEFTDNSDKWSVKETEDYKFEIANGTYSLTGKTGGRWTVHSFPIRRDADYVLETKIKSDSPTTTDYAGIIWDSKDKDHYYQFLASQHGKYAILKMENGTANFLVPWTASSVINGRGMYNTLRVARVGRQLVFSINKVEIKSLPYESFAGESIGFSFLGTQTITVDSVLLLEERTMTGEKTELPSRRDTMFESRFNEKNQSWLISARNLTGQFTDLGGSAGLGYLLKHGSRSSIDMLAQDFSLDLSRDFFVEAEIEWISGDEGYAYGLACDVNGRDYLWFGLTANGFYSISRTLGGEKKELVPWTMSDNVNCYEARNRLAVHRRASSLIFSINGRKVYEMPYEAWSSRRIGFGAGGNMSIRPRFLGLYQTSIQAGPIHGGCSYGWGAYRYADGAVYVGFWERGKPNGFGTQYSPSLGLMEGLWKDGTLHRGASNYELAPGRTYFSVMTASGDMGLVNDWGEEEGFGLRGVVYLDSILETPLLQASEGRIGFMDWRGDLISSPEWNIASPFSHGYALVKGTKGGTGIVDSVGKLSLALGAYDILPSNDVKRGVVRVKATKDGKTLYGLVSVDGKVLIPPSLLDLGDFSEGYAPAKARNGYYGFVDLLGVWRVAPVYDGAGDFSENRAYVYIDDYLAWESFIRPSGETTFDLDNEIHETLYPNRFSEGLLACMEDGENLVYLNWYGEVLVRAGAWDDARPFSEGFAAVKDENGWQYIDDTGLVAFDGVYGQALSFSQDLAAVRKGDRWGYIDRTGQFVIPAGYLDAHSFLPQGFAQVKLPSGAWTWIDREGELLWPGR